jgi:ABC-2 type transport system permease protein
LFGRAFAENQLVTAIVEAIPALLSDQPVGNDIWVAPAWCVGIMLVAYVLRCGRINSGCEKGTSFKDAVLMARSWTN